MAFIECVGFILIRDGKVLLEKRRKDKPVDAGKIAIPKGHMEPGESELEAVKREMMEELGVSLAGQHYVCSVVNLAEEHQRLHYYWVSEWQGDIQCHEAESVGWYPVSDHPIEVASDSVALSECLRLYGRLLGESGRTG